MRLANPASRTLDADALAPATARIKQTLVTSPSLTPSTAARAAPRDTWATRPARAAASDARSTWGRAAPTRAGRTRADSIIRSSLVLQGGQVGQPAVGMAR